MLEYAFTLSIIRCIDIKFYKKLYTRKTYIVSWANLPDLLGVFLIMRALRKNLRNDWLKEEALVEELIMKYK